MSETGDQGARILNFISSDKAGDLVRRKETQGAMPEFLRAVEAPPHALPCPVDLDTRSDQPGFRNQCSQVREVGRGGFHARLFPQFPQCSLGGGFLRVDKPARDFPRGSAQRVAIDMDQAEFPVAFRQYGYTADAVFAQRFRDDAQIVHDLPPVRLFQPVEIDRKHLVAADQSAVTQNDGSIRLAAGRVAGPGRFLNALGLQFGLVIQVFLLDARLPAWILHVPVTRIPDHREALDELANAGIQ